MYLGEIVIQPAGTELARIIITFKKYNYIFKIKEKNRVRNLLLQWSSVPVLQLPRFADDSNSLVGMGQDQSGWALQNTQG